MGHPFPIREIARQSGLSEATVDRVLNERGGVRPGTVRQVRQAVTDLRRQETQLRLGGRTFMTDVVMQAPERFSTAVREALEAEMPALRPAVIRARFHFRESGPAAALVAVLDRIADGGRRRSQGVLLKAPDVPEVNEAVRRLSAAGIPVVTLVTDLPDSGRVAYLGIDNRAAGATAAYLVRQWLGDRPGAVLTTLSRGFFRGEEEREMGFRAGLRECAPHLAVVGVPDSDGLDATTGGPVREALRRDPGIRAVYSIGGGNTAILDAFDTLGRECAVFVAHDLDGDNRRLLHARRLSAVLHHDLRQDMRHACQAVMRAQGALPGPVRIPRSPVQVVTPFNVPPPHPG